MKRLPLVLLLLFVALGRPLPAAADRGGFVIERFDVDLTVRPDARLEVVEHLVVNFTAPRRGLYRDIPVRYTDPLGFGYSLGIHLESVVDDAGRTHPVKVTNHGRYLRIRIGDPRRTRTWRVVYILRYRVRNALRSFPDHDELYWNATGNEWRTTIGAASASIHLPAPFPADSLEFAGYTGTYGSRETAVTVARPDPSTAVVAARAPLDPFNGLTVVAAWPRGAVAFPGLWSRLGRFLVDNLILLIPPIVLWILFARYRTRGRDPRGPESVVVRYEPPPGVSPAELGTLVDERVDLRDITATLVDLAVRGFLEIRVEERALFLGLGKRQAPVFERKRRENEQLLPHERLLLDGFFETGDRVETNDLRNRFYKHLPRIKKAVEKRLTALGHFAENPSTVRTRYVGGGFLFGILTFLAGFLWGRFRGGVLPNALVFPILCAGLVLVLFIGFSRSMPRRTASGVRLRQWARGFEEFAERVEGDHLDRDRARGVFESLLPFAMALGVAEAWAERFEHLYDEAPPTWYAGAFAPGVFSTSALERSLSSAVAETGKSMAAAPRSSSSSGSGGGGFSGGGGGGGGGGSW